MFDSNASLLKSEGYQVANLELANCLLDKSKTSHVELACEDSLGAIVRSPTSARKPKYSRLVPLTDYASAAALSIAEKHGVRLRFAVRWIVAARGIGLGDVARELDIGASHLSHLLANPSAYAFDAHRRPELAVKLCVDVFSFRADLIDISRPVDMPGMVRGLLMLGVPQAIAINMALDAIGVDVERDIAPSLKLCSRAVLRRIAGEIQCKPDERAVFQELTGFDPWTIADHVHAARSH